MMINGRYYTETEAAAYINCLLALLTDVRPLLSYAFFADHKLQSKADKLIAQIDSIPKGASK